MKKWALNTAHIEDILLHSHNAALFDSAILSAVHLLAERPKSEEWTIHNF